MAVEGEQSTGAPPSCEDDDAQVGESDVEVRITSFEVDDNAMIIGFEATNRKAAGCQVLEERDTSAAPEPPSEQIVHLGCHRSRDDEFTRLLLQQRFDPRPHRVSPISQRDEWRGIDDESHTPKPSRSSSSPSAAIDPPGPSALRASEKFRSPRVSGS